jgi:hypothetical protein
MKRNLWTIGLAAAGVISLATAGQAEEAPHQVMTALSSTTLSGYVDTSANWHFGAGNAARPGWSFDGASKQDGFNLNVVKLSIEKPLSEGQWAAGYKVDLLAGPDAVGYNPAIGGGGDFGIKQAYVALRAPVGNGLDFKIGTFDTIIGYEVFESGANPNFSRSYGYFIEPTSHTGVLATYQVNEVIGVSAGVANTYGAGINARSNPPRAESEKTYMASITLTAPDSMGALAHSALYAGVVKGFNGTFAGTTGSGVDTTSYYVGATVPTPLKNTTVGAAYDYRASGVFKSSYENATGLYVSYGATPKLRLNARGEYATGSSGAYGVGAMPNSNVSLTETTLTADYSLWANVITRAELRWDHNLGGYNIYPGATGAAAKKNDYSLTLNVIYKF